MKVEFWTKEEKDILDKSDKYTKEELYLLLPNRSKKYIKSRHKHIVWL